MPSLSGSPLLDTVVGLGFLFALLSLIASGVAELVARWLNLRSRDLEKALRQLLTDDPGHELAVRKVLEHPLLDVLGDPTKRSFHGRMPSYIPSHAFASAVLDILAPSSADGDPLADIDGRIAALPDGALRGWLQALARDVGSERDRLRAGLESWYDATMDRASGWYKRRAQTMLLAIGVALALAVNADAIRVATTLWHDPAQRAVVLRAAETAVAEQATAAAADPGEAAAGNAGASLDAVARRLDDVDDLQLPLGWSTTSGDPRDVPDDLRGVVMKLLGILVTGFAVSLGAPFWFDLVGRGVSLRSAGRRPPPSQADATS